MTPVNGVDPRGRREVETLNIVESAEPAKSKNTLPDMLILMGIRTSPQLRHRIPQVIRSLVVKMLSTVVGLISKERIGVNLTVMKRAMCSGSLHAGRSAW